MKIATMGVAVVFYTLTYYYVEVFPLASALYLIRDGNCHNPGRLRLFTPMDFLHGSLSKLAQ